MVTSGKRNRKLAAQTRGNKQAIIHEGPLTNKKPTIFRILRGILCNHSQAFDYNLLSTVYQAKNINVARHTCKLYRIQTTIMTYSIYICESRRAGSDAQENTPSTSQDLALNLRTSVIFVISVF